MGSKQNSNTTRKDWDVPLNPNDAEYWEDHYNPIIPHLTPRRVFVRTMGNFVPY